MRSLKWMSIAIADDTHFLMDFESSTDALMNVVNIVAVVNDVLVDGTDR